jgi:hypothetical protein
VSQFEEGAWYLKRDLISKAQSIAYSGDLRKGHDEIQALREKWKTAGRAGTDSEGNNVDNVLHSEFKQVCDQFYERRKQARDSAIAVKRAIVYEMGKLATRSYDKSVGEEARALMTRWKEAERAPKAEEDQLWYELNKYRDQIAEARRRKSEEHGDRQIQYKRGQISDLQSQISDIQSEIYAIELELSYNTSSTRYAKAQERIAKKRERIAKLQSWIDQHEAAIAEIERARYR